MIQRNNYVTIQGFMVTDLNLKGNELLIYALIYGFSQDGLSEFTGSISYIQEWFKLDKKTVITTLKKLVDKKLVCKEEIEVAQHLKLCRYKASADSGGKIPPPVEKFPRSGGKIPLRQGKNSTGGGGKIPPNNTNNNNLNNNTHNTVSEHKKRHGYECRDYTEEFLEEALL